MHAPSPGLYKDAYERDSCGFGLIASLDDEPSHWLVQTAISSLNRLTHRGAIADRRQDRRRLRPAAQDSRSAFLRAVADEAGITLGAALRRRARVPDPRCGRGARRRARVLDGAARARGAAASPAGASCPSTPSACGPEALQDRCRASSSCSSTAAAPISTRPRSTGGCSWRGGAPRRRSRRATRRSTSRSLSASTLVYKGMVMPQHLAEFYPDLDDPRLEASVAVFHQRFSTNTLPQWRLAHPYRYLAHNGEINTVQGNRSWAVARGPLLRSPLLPDLGEVLPLVSLTGSDSQSLDNMLEVLLMGGLDPLHAMRLLIPPAWHRLDTLDPGPARLLRVLLGAHGALGRPGRHRAHRRPLRAAARSIATACARRASCITKNRHLTIASESGRVGLPARGRGEQGQARARRDARARSADRHAARLARRRPISQEPPSLQGVAQEGRALPETDLIDPRLAAEPMDRDTLALYQKMFNVIAGGARRDHPRAGRGRERGGRLDGR